MSARHFEICDSFGRLSHVEGGHGADPPLFLVMVPEELRRRVRSRRRRWCAHSTHSGKHVKLNVWLRRTNMDPIVGTCSSGIGASAAVYSTRLPGESGVQSAIAVLLDLVQMALVNVQSLSNKAFVLSDVLNSYALDFMFITETWMREGDVLPLYPPDIRVFRTPRLSGRGWGIASLFI